MNFINPEKNTEKLVGFIRASFKDAGFTKAVIGVSGGVDSAAVCALAVRALGKENVCPVLLPYGTLSTQGTLDAMSFVQSLDIPLSNITRIDIKPAADKIAENSTPVNNVRRGNIMARVRMIYLFDQARRRAALVVGTENKTERLLGYFTRYGDEASDIEPIRGLYKTQVYELARYLSIPDSIVSKIPSAGLWEGQTDEGEFGFTYRDADAVLSAYVDEGKTEGDIVGMGYKADVVRRILERSRQNAFKYRLPLVPGTGK